MGTHILANVFSLANTRYTHHLQKSHQHSLNFLVLKNIVVAVTLDNMGKQFVGRKIRARIRAAQQEQQNLTDKISMKQSDFMNEKNLEQNHFYENFSNFITQIETSLENFNAAANYNTYAAISVENNNLIKGEAVFQSRITL